jgi:hypothetical protein
VGAALEYTPTSGRLDGIVGFCHTILEKIEGMKHKNAKAAKGEKEQLVHPQDCAALKLFSQEIATMRHRLELPPPKPKATIFHMPGSPLSMIHMPSSPSFASTSVALRGRRLLPPVAKMIPRKQYVPPAHPNPDPVETFTLSLEESIELSSLRGE